MSAVAQGHLGDEESLMIDHLTIGDFECYLKGFLIYHDDLEHIGRISFVSETSRQVQGEGAWLSNTFICLYCSEHKLWLRAGNRQSPLSEISDISVSGDMSPVLTIQYAPDDTLKIAYEDKIAHIRELGDGFSGWEPDHFDYGLWLTNIFCKSTRDSNLARLWSQS